MTAAVSIPAPPDSLCSMVRRAVFPALLSDREEDAMEDAMEGVFNVCGFAECLSDLDRERHSAECRTNGDAAEVDRYVDERGDR